MLERVRLRVCAELFGELGPLKSASLGTKPDGTSKCFALVTYKRKADEATHEVDDLHVALESEQTWVSEMQRKHETEREDAASLLRQRDATVSRLEERLRQAEANVFEKFQRFFTAEYGGEVSRADEDLGGFLGKIGLSVHHEALEEMGARRISDLIHLEEPDLEQLGMSTLQKRKMMRAVHELRMNQDIICTVM